MSLNNYIALLVVFWLLVHFRHRQILSSHAGNNSLLPLANARLRPTRSLINLGHLLRVDLPSFLVLRVSTIVFNDFHRHLVGGVSRKLSSVNHRLRKNNDNKRDWNWVTTIKVFYDVGSVIAVIGQILGFGGLSWCLFQLFYQYQNNHPIEIPTVSQWKRSIPPVGPASNDVFLKPLIPGVTLPISHAFPIFLSMIACTTIHELGHALVAAIDGIPLLSWGYSLIFIVPTAFVELAGSSNSNKDHSASSRLRIAAAGAFHNVLTLCVLYLASYVSIGRVSLRMLGYVEVLEGVVVVDVSEGSPLRPFLASGFVITDLDDTPLVKMPNVSVQNIWDTFLMMDTAVVDDQYQSATPLGWCMGQNWFDSRSTTCCTRNTTLVSISNSTTAGSCFIPHSNSKEGHCIDPVPLFENYTIQRCTSDVVCNAETGGTDICIRPHPSTSLLRISVKESGNTGVGKVVVWSGPRREVWEQVTIGTYLPGFPLLHVGLPAAGKLLFEYLKVVSISLFFFNILPVRILDGGEIFSSFLDVLIIWKTGNDRVFGDVDLEQGEGSIWRGSVVRGAVWTRRARWFESWIEKTTIFLVAVVLLGGVVVTGIG
ncbi:hypothetical protein BU17DRAFT_39700 [Hysterangium stoloniferum]|nr:hypothetical protein BU17DRAFT_39700 [Hysterangium stoloniferum]